MKIRKTKIIGISALVLSGVLGGYHLTNVEKGNSPLAIINNKALMKKVEGTDINKQQITVDKLQVGYGENYSATYDENHPNLNVSLEINVQGPIKEGDTLDLKLALPVSDSGQTIHYEEFLRLSDRKKDLKLNDGTILARSVGGKYVFTKAAEGRGTLFISLKSSNRIKKQITLIGNERQQPKVMDIALLASGEEIGRKHGIEMMTHPTAIDEEEVHADNIYSYKGFDFDSQNLTIEEAFVIKVKQFSGRDSRYLLQPGDVLRFSFNNINNEVVQLDENTGVKLEYQNTIGGQIEGSQGAYAPMSLPVQNTLKEIKNTIAEKQNSATIEYEVLDYAELNKDSIHEISHGFKLLVNKTKLENQELNTWLIPSEFAPTFTFEVLRNGKPVDLNYHKKGESTLTETKKHELVAPGISLKQKEKEEIEEINEFLYEDKEEEIIDNFKTEIIIDETLEKDEVVVDQSGIDGRKQVSYRAKIRRATGEIVEKTNEKTKKITDLQNEKIRVGYAYEGLTDDSLEEIPFEVEKTGTQALEKGKEQTKRAGEKGEKRKVGGEYLKEGENITLVKDGVLKTVKEPINEQIEVGTKTTETTNEDPKTLYVIDPEVERDTLEKTQEGQPGAVTKVYESAYDPKTGEFASPQLVDTINQGKKDTIYTVGVGYQPDGVEGLKPADWLEELKVTKNFLPSFDLAFGNQIKITEGTQGKRVRKMTYEVENGIAKAVETGEWVTKIKHVDETWNYGTKEIIKEVKVFDEWYIIDPSVNEAYTKIEQKGENGSVETIYERDVHPETGKVNKYELKDQVVKEGKPKIMRVGFGHELKAEVPDSEFRKVTQPKTVYQGNTEKKVGTREVLNEGKEGTAYRSIKVDYYGDILERLPWKDEVEAENKVIELGAREEKEETIPFKETLLIDPAYVGEPSILTEGTDGTRRVVYYLKFDKDTGEEVSKEEQSSTNSEVVNKKTRVSKTDPVVEQLTDKDKVEEIIPYETIKEETKELKPGEEKTVQQGENGLKQRRVLVELNKAGKLEKVLETEDWKVIHQATPEIIQVGVEKEEDKPTPTPDEEDKPTPKPNKPKPEPNKPTPEKPIPSEQKPNQPTPSEQPTLKPSENVFDADAHDVVHNVPQDVSRDVPRDVLQEKEEPAQEEVVVRVDKNEEAPKVEKKQDKLKPTGGSYITSTILSGLSMLGLLVGYKKKR